VNPQKGDHHDRSRDLHGPYRSPPLPDQRSGGGTRRPPSTDSRNALAQAPGIKRTDLQRHDRSVPGREVIQVLVEFAPGVVAPNHSHPGEEIVYVVEGLLE
jgi:hypothetical protein